MIENKMHISLEQLKNLELHDQSMENLFIDFSSGVIKIKVEVYNDDISAYEGYELVFTDVSQINFTGFDIDSVSSIEIYDMEVDNKSGKNVAKFILLLSPGKRDVSIEFSFNSCYKVPC